MYTYKERIYSDFYIFVLDLQQEKKSTEQKKGVPLYSNLC
ncbi:hypothetical protein BACEGG_01290 [Bacteroides eggerthii DSM 20697]|nr:hypothetical protein BACEGG_01290 [Bacteroides eggerthii DSM 20697]